MTGNSIIENNYTGPDETEYTIAESSWLMWSEMELKTFSHKGNYLLLLKIVRQMEVGYWRRGSLLNIEYITLHMELALSIDLQQNAQ
jgi:hypothetical protein